MSGESPSPERSPADFLKTALGRVQANLELFLGKELEVSHGEPAAAKGAELADRLPARGLVLGVRVSGAVDAEIHCVAALPLMMAMSAHARHQTDAQVAERLSGPSDLDEAEREGIKEAGSFITAALGDFAKEATGGRIVLAPTEARFAARGEDPPWPLGEAGYGLEATIEVGGAPPSLIILFAPAAVVDAWAGPGAGQVFAGGRPDRPKTERPKPERARTERPKTVRGPAPAAAAAAPAPAPEPSPPPAATRGAAPPGPAAPQPVQKPAAPVAVAAWAAGSEAFLASVTAAAGQALAIQTFASLADVVDAAGTAAGPPLLVVEVPAESEFELDLIAALRRQPAFAETRMMVGLEAPSRSNVLRCGVLGLLDVVPASLDGPALSERLLAVARRRPPDPPR
jgi:hypothetical protein